MGLTVKASNTLTMLLHGKFIVSRPGDHIVGVDRITIGAFTLQAKTRMITIYHNPRCSKSREALALVEAYAKRQQIPVNVVEYLTSPPSLEQIKELQAMLGCRASGMVRSNEEEFAALGLEHAADADLLRAIAAHPRLLQRPIVVFGKRAVIGRPPELVSSLLENCAD